MSSTIKLQYKSLIIIFLYLFFFNLLNPFHISGQSSTQELLPQLLRLDSLLYAKAPQEAFPPGILDFFSRQVLMLEKQERKKDSYSLLQEYYQEPHLNQLYQDELRLYDSQTIQEIVHQISKGFIRLKKRCPSMPIPKYIAFHVSGFQQNIIVTSDLLSVSLDLYLGENYPLYNQYFSPWKRGQMKKEQIAIDALKGWILSEIPLPKQNLTLRTYFRYWGGIYALLHKIFPHIPETQLFSFTEKELHWLKRNKKILIKNALVRKELDSPSPLIIDKYFSELPLGTSLPNEAPRCIGYWLSYKLYPKG